MRARRKTRIRCTALVVLIAGSVALTPSKSYASTLDENRNTLIEQVNAMRTAAGVCPFGFDLDVQNVAQSWADHMAANNALTHNPAMPLGAGFAGENVAETHGVADVTATFVASPGHFRNLMDPRFDRIGIGITNANGHIWTTYNFTASNIRGC